MQHPPEVSAIVVTWNSIRWIAACLESLIEDLKTCSYEIMVVDNASSDGTADSVQERFPEVRLIRNTKNVGFAMACNQALLLNRAEYVLFLNPDTKILPGAVRTLVEFMNKQPQAGAVGPILLNPDGSLQLTGNAAPSLRNIFSETFFLDRLFPRSPVWGAHKQSHRDRAGLMEVDWTMGACLMVRRSALEKVGPYDENFFLFFEETDLCLRLKKAGYKIFVIQEAKVIHYGGTGLAHYTAHKIVNYHKSLFYFAQKYFTRRQRWTLRIIILVRTGIRLMVWAILLPYYGKVSVEKLKGYGAVLKVCFYPMKALR